MRLVPIVTVLWEVLKNAKKFNAHRLWKAAGQLCLKVIVVQLNTNAVSWIRPQTNEKFNFFCLLCCSSSAPKFSRYRSDLSLESRAENDNYDDPTIESITESDFSTESSNLAAQDLNGIDLNVGLIDFNEKIVNQSLAEKVIEENIGQPVLMNIDLRKQLHKANEFNSFQDQLQTTKVREQNQTHDKNRVENFIDGLIRVIDLRFQNRLPAEPRIDSHKTNDENEPLKYDSNLELTSMIDNLNYLNESEILNLYNGTIDIINVSILLVLKFTSTASNLVESVKLIIWDESNEALLPTESGVTVMISIVPL